MKLISLKDQLEEEEFDSESSSPSKQSKRAKKERAEKAPPSARNTALRMISMRDYSSRELRTKLSEKGFSTEEIREVLDFLREKRFLDDIRYGKKLIRYMAERRYFGAYKIRMELSLKLDREWIEMLLPDELEEYDFSLLATELVHKPQLRGKSREALIRKLKASGYGVQEIRSALATLSADE